MGLRFLMSNEEAIAEIQNDGNKHSFWWSWQTNQRRIPLTADDEKYIVGLDDGQEWFLSEVRLVDGDLKGKCWVVARSGDQLAYGIPDGGPVVGGIIRRLVACADDLDVSMALSRLY